VQDVRLGFVVFYFQDNSQQFLKISHQKTYISPEKLLSVLKNPIQGLRQLSDDHVTCLFAAQPIASLL
jgi:hypothetical protein